MKAVRIHEYGTIDTLRYENSAEPKMISTGDAIVKLKAASINRTDLRTRRGVAGVKVSFPHILGGDGAGIVVELGEGARNIKPGDAVCLYPAIGCGGCLSCLTDREFMCSRLTVLGERDDGTYADYVRVPARNCFPIPPTLTFEEAAAFPLVYLTVWRMLLTNAGLRSGEFVLIVGIGGGVATAALQLAAHLGTHIIVTSSSDQKLAEAKNFGAEHGINYHEADFAKEVRLLTGKRGVDVVVDCVGADSWVKSLASLARGGRLVTCGATTGVHPQTDLRRIFWNNLKVFGSSLGTRDEFRQVLNFMKTTRTKPIIDQVFPLKDAAAAQGRLEEGKQFGKIVLRMDN